MPFDDKKWNIPAPRGEAGGIALDTAIALQGIARALRVIADKHDIDLSAEIAAIEQSHTSLWRTFKSMTGWDS